MFKRKHKHQKETRRPQVTRTGSPVFSYAAQRIRSEDSTERAIHVAPKNERNWLVLLPSIISAIVVVLSLIYATTLSNSPRIITIVDNNRKLLRDEEYYQAVFQEILSKSVLNYSKLTINTVAVAEEIELKYPELQNVSVSLPLLGRKPVVQIQPSTPAFIIVSRSGSYLINSEGRAMLRTQDAAISGLGLTTVTDDTGLEVSTGKTILPRDNIEFITTVLYQLKQQKIDVQSVNLPPISNEMHLRLQGRQYFVKFNLQGSAMEQAGALLAIKERLESEDQSPTEYIDVRVQDRAYVK